MGARGRLEDGRRRGMSKPEGPMLYTVQKGANALPRRAVKDVLLAALLLVLLLGVARCYFNVHVG